MVGHETSNSKGYRYVELAYRFLVLSSGPVGTNLAVDFESVEDLTDSREQRLVCREVDALLPACLWKLSIGR